MSKSCDFVKELFDYLLLYVLLELVARSLVIDVFLISINRYSALKKLLLMLIFIFVMSKSFNKVHHSWIALSKPFGRRIFKSNRLLYYCTNYFKQFPSLTHLIRFIGQANALSNRFFFTVFSDSTLLIKVF